MTKLPDPRLSRAPSARPRQIAWGLLHRVSTLLTVAICLLATSCAGRGVTIEPVIARASDDATATRLYTDLLGTFVENGHVDYAGLCADDRLATYVAHLSAVAPEQLDSDAARLAFWINVYNAFTLKIICDNYPLESINDLHFGGLAVGVVLKSTIWDKDFIVISGRSLSLNDIEHGIIRPSFAEPRAHFALVCASVSCPPLRPEAYDPGGLDAQLQDQGRIFLNDVSKNALDGERRRAHISRIFDWFRKDFGEDDAAVLGYLSQFMPDTTRAALVVSPEAWEVDYQEYDWSLNQ